MKEQIRLGVWETNSSSVNTLMIMSAEEYKDFMDKWNSNDWVWDRYGGAWVHVDDKEEDSDEYTYSPNPCENEWSYFEKETQTYTTKHGDEIVAVSIYGYDG